MVHVQTCVPHTAVHSQTSPHSVPTGKSVHVAFGGWSKRLQMGTPQFQVLVPGSQVHDEVPPSVVHLQ
jgi:hypothetical protein